MNDDPTPKNQRQFIDYRFNELDKKVIDIQQTLRQFTFVKQIEFDEFKKDVKENYVTKESFDPFKRTLTQVGSIIIGAIVLAILGLVLRK